MIDGKKKKEELFADWLAQNVPLAQLSEMYLCYSEIESFCTKIKVLRSPLFETVDLETIKKVQKIVTENRIFRFSHRKQMKKMVAAMQYYLAFVKAMEKTKDNENKAKAEEESLQSELIAENGIVPDKGGSEVKCTEEEIKKTLLYVKVTELPLNHLFLMILRQPHNRTHITIKKEPDASSSFKVLSEDAHRNS